MHCYQTLFNNYTCFSVQKNKNNIFSIHTLKQCFTNVLLESVLVQTLTQTFYFPKYCPIFIKMKVRGRIFINKLIFWQKLSALK